MRTETDISVDHLSKQFGSVKAVDDLSFTVRPGAVTGFLGPNGAGKTTTLRMLLGLVRPSSGTALIGGRRYEEIPTPAWTTCGSTRPRWAPRTRAATSCSSWWA